MKTMMAFLGVAFAVIFLAGAVFAFTPGWGRGSFDGTGPYGRTSTGSYARADAAPYGNWDRGWRGRQAAGRDAYGSGAYGYGACPGWGYNTRVGRGPGGCWR